MSAIIPVFGQGTQGKSVNVTAQRRINLYAEQSDDKAQTVYYGRPGLVRALDAESGSERDAGPARGAVSMFAVQSLGDTKDNPLVLMPASHWYYYGLRSNSINTSGYTNTDPHRIRTSVGPVRGATNGSTALFVDGTSAYSGGSDVFSIHLYDMNGPDYTTNIGGSYLYTPDFPFGATSVCFIAGRYVVNDPRHPGRFVWSDLLPLWTPSSYWDALNYATAESVPDPLTAVVSHNNQLLLFGSESLEFWSATGGDEVFAATGGAAQGWGCAAIDSIRELNSSLFFLGTSTLGNRQVCMLNGYQVQPISTPDVEKLINDDPTPDAAVALAFITAGHAFYVLNLTNTSLAYNLNTGEWSEWQTEGGRWAGQWGFNYNGGFYVTDYRNSNIYRLDDDVQTDDGQPIVREITSKHIFNNTDRLCVDQVAMDAEMGVGITSGQGSDPKVMMQISTDGGHTFGDEMWRTLGALGQYKARAVWNRLGRARDFVFRWRIADPVKVVIMNIAARIRP